MYLGVLRFYARKPAWLLGVDEKCASKVSKSGDTSRSTSLPRKRKAAAWNPDYLATVLRLHEI